MLTALPSFPADVERFGAGYLRAVRFWEPEAILATGLAFRLWERIFLEQAPTLEPPTWQTIWEQR